MTVAPIDPGLFASLDPPALRGSRCTQCRTTVFPVAGSCPRCSSSEVEPAALPDRGTVWTYTVQGFEPKPPYVAPASGFAPYAVGYVDLGDVLVEGHLLVDPSALAIGLPVRLVLEETPLGSVTFAFEEDA